MSRQASSCSGSHQDTCSLNCVPVVSHPKARGEGKKKIKNDEGGGGPALLPSGQSASGQVLLSLPPPLTLPWLGGCQFRGHGHATSPTQDTLPLAV